MGLQVCFLHKMFYSIFCVVLHPGAGRWVSTVNRLFLGLLGVFVICIIRVRHIS